MMFSFIKPILREKSTTNMSNSSIINIEEFLKIYPPFPNKNTIFMGPSKFSKIFSFEKEN